MSIEYPDKLSELMTDDTITLVYRVLATVNCDHSIIPKLDRVSDMDEEKMSGAIQSILDGLESPIPENTDDDRIL